MISCYILQRNIPKSHQWIRFTASQRVKHASGTAPVRLFLLLRSHVDIPPERPLNFDIFIQYVLDYAPTPGHHTRCHSRITLHIDRFERIVKRDVSKVHISNAIVHIVRNYSAQSHAHAVPDLDVAHANVLSARNLVSFHAWFRHNSIVKKGHFEPFDGYVSTARI